MHQCFRGTLSACLGRKVPLIAALFLSLVLSGCSNNPFEPKPVMMDLSKGTVLTTTASLRNTFIHDPNEKIIVCAEPSPDSGFTQNQSGSTSFSLISTGNDSISESEGSAENEMSGRVPSLLLARELLYRLCEFARNNNLDQTTVVDLYKQNLTIIQNISGTVASNTTISVSDAESASTQVGVTETAAPAPAASGAASFTDDQMTEICGDNTTDYYNSETCKPYR